VIATIKALVMEIAATTAASAIRGAASGSSRITRLPPNIGVGRSAGRDMIAACSAHSRMRNTVIGIAMASPTATGDTATAGVLDRDLEAGADRGQGGEDAVMARAHGAARRRCADRRDALPRLARAAAHARVARCPRSV
jgi:hypothetical protein